MDFDEYSIRNGIDESHGRKTRYKGLEDRKTIEGVLDLSTAKIVYSLINKGFLEKMIGVVATGKESNVYLVTPGKKARSMLKDAPNQEEIALKIYRTSTLDFKNIRRYIDGDPRFRRTRKGSRHIIWQWAMKEFKNLKRSHDSGIRVPKPIVVRKNVLAMEFLGENGTPGPLLKEVSLANYQETWEDILEILKKLYQASRIVHGDLSEYNILIYQDLPFFIDMSQSVLDSHPMADQWLIRDIRNLKNFFTDKVPGISSEEALFHQITDRRPPSIVTNGI